MQRWLTTLVGIAAVALSILMVARTFHAPKAIGSDPSRPVASAATVDDGGGLLYAYGNAPAERGTDSGGTSVESSELIDGFPVGQAGQLRVRADAGYTAAMPDGSPVPPLPVDVPRRVRLGVVLVSYAGAQQSPGVHSVTRSRAEARTLAEKLLATAQQDFHAAVEQGDSGSTDDLGQVKVGVLEPAPEYVLFTTPVNGVAGPVDTPRGYWIVKRLE
jgi:PPIC-type PPIASE domain